MISRLTLIVLCLYAWSCLPSAICKAQFKPKLRPPMRKVMMETRASVKIESKRVLAKDVLKEKMIAIGVDVEDVMIREQLLRVVRELIVEKIVEERRATASKLPQLFEGIGEKETDVLAESGSVVLLELLLGELEDKIPPQWVKDNKLVLGANELRKHPQFIGLFDSLVAVRFQSTPNGAVVNVKSGDYEDSLDLSRDLEVQFVPAGNYNVTFSLPKRMASWDAPLDSRNRLVQFISRP